jgi:hypothetical protein
MSDGLSQLAKMPSRRVPEWAAMGGGIRPTADETRRDAFPTWTAAAAPSHAAWQAAIRKAYLTTARAKTRHSQTSPASTPEHRPTASARTRSSVGQVAPFKPTDVADPRHQVEIQPVVPEVDLLPLHGRPQAGTPAIGGVAGAVPHPIVALCLGAVLDNNEIPVLLRHQSNAIAQPNHEKRRLIVDLGRHARTLVRACERKVKQSVHTAQSGCLLQVSHSPEPPLPGSAAAA